MIAQVKTALAADLIRGCLPTLYDEPEQLVALMDSQELEQVLHASRAGGLNRAGGIIQAILAMRRRIAQDNYETALLHGLTEAQEFYARLTIGQEGR